MRDITYLYLGIRNQKSLIPQILFSPLLYTSCSDEGELTMKKDTANVPSEESDGGSINESGNTCAFCK